MKAIERIETKKNFDVIKQDALERINNPKYQYECLAILLGLETGLRASDLLKLKTSNISYNEDANRYEVITHIQKTDVKNHRTQISNTTYKAIKRIVKDNDTYIFANKKNNNKLFSRIWLTKRTKLRYGFSFHELRRISAKWILKDGTILDAQKHLAHKRTTSTDKYLNITEQDYLDRMQHKYA
jgi:integrase